jgi:hypothetical protein
MKIRFSAALVAALAATAATAQTKWDLPSGYGANTYQVQNLQQFADDVDKATGGKLKITVHPNASLFKARDQARRAGGAGTDRRDPAGQLPERMADVRCRRPALPGHSYAASMPPALRPSEALLSKKLAEQGMMLLYAVAWPPQGLYSKKPIAAPTT